MAGGWTQVVFKMPSNSSHSMISQLGPTFNASRGNSLRQSFGKVERETDLCFFLFLWCVQLQCVRLETWGCEQICWHKLLDVYWGAEKPFPALLEAADCFDILSLGLLCKTGHPCTKQFVPLSEQALGSASQRPSKPSWEGLLGHTRGCWRASGP